MPMGITEAPNAKALSREHDPQDAPCRRPRGAVEVFDHTAVTLGCNVLPERDR
jgi:hypothetical protein